MSPPYTVGQTVVYKPIGGPESENTPESLGLITGVLTSPGKIDEYNVEASPEEPTYEIENMSTKKKSPIKDANVLRIHI
ncbi:hypothetical protein FQN54_006076 [Arachnomyces sp. PD_36]|nr:hypothetical protein FQN54_006076 [Arachnomyces sp. PD_36]